MATAEITGANCFIIASFFFLSLFDFLYIECGEEPKIHVNSLNPHFWGS